ncbi:hypothetical protein L211DRAFT_854308 [Terfezia boudieri ATCC MYA-4762]|uniref:Uncharacterized protein n=1 Tax=Terfezia boudieri ATCC MYA-4762 TaxID=1051890 RepID=A0A3N4LC69_9PEZI|nr:hypothetical protein L211DRAFT_854308 [Terfezia boudieri ATCC MYA-4762]
MTGDRRYGALHRLMTPEGRLMTPEGRRGGASGDQASKRSLEGYNTSMAIRGIGGTDLSIVVEDALEEEDNSKIEGEVENAENIEDLVNSMQALNIAYFVEMHR